MGECMQSYNAVSLYDYVNEIVGLPRFCDLLHFVTTDKYKNGKWVLIGIANGSKEIYL